MFVFGYVGDIFDLRKLLTLAYLGMGITNLALGLGGMFECRSEVFYYIDFACIGVSSAIVFPNFVSVMSNWFPKKNRGFFIGLWSTCVGIGNIVGI